jgi:phosphatidylserine decarboxylase
MIVPVFIVLLLILCGIMWFFRAPSGTPLTVHGAILSPAYGEVRRVHGGEQTTIVIFLSPLDIHRQYFPCAGRIKSRIYDKNGNFYLAYDLDKSSMNEKVITVLETEFGDIEIRQIAGWFARVISPACNVGDYVGAGDPAGMIEFGSRVDVVLPKTLVPAVDVGMYVNGYETILAQLADNIPAAAPAMQIAPSSAVVNSSP